MPKKKKINQILSEHIIEIRFKPNANILDKRGEITTALTSNIFDQWSISDQQILLSSKENTKVQGSFSYKNTSFQTSYPNNTEFFLSHAENFIKSSWSSFPSNEIARIGIRTRYIVPVKDFKTAFDSYRKTFLGLNDKQIERFGGNLIDLGFPLNFVDGQNFFNVTTGPMEKKQFIQIFKEEDGEDFFADGLFLDVDYFKQEFSPYTKQKDVINFMKAGVKKAETVLSVVTDLIIKK